MPEATFDETFTRVRDELMRFEGIKPLDAPATFQGELRAYQRDGLGWMDFLRRFGFGGCLADDMGLGKTVQVLALLESRRRNARDGRRQRCRRSDEHGRQIEQAAARLSASTPSPRPTSLVVAPAVADLQLEAGGGEVHAGPAGARPHAGRSRSKGSEHFDDYDLILTTYGTLRRDAGVLQGRRRSTTRCSTRRRRSRTPAASRPRPPACSGPTTAWPCRGTPVQNHLGELWSLFEFLNPGMMGSATRLHARRRRRRRQRPRDAHRPGPGDAAVHPAPHQGAGRQGPAAEAGADALLRAGARAAQALQRAARPLPHQPAGAHRQGGHEQGEDPGPGSAAAAPPGRLPSRPDRQVQGQGRQRQARHPDGPARRGAGRRPQGAGLLAVHQLPVDRPQAARRGRDRSTNTSTARPATARNGSSASRTTRTASCSSSASRPAAWA